MSARTAEVAFRYFTMYHITDRLERIDVLRRLTARHKARYVRDAKAFIDAQLKAGKKIIEIKNNKPLTND